MKVIKRLHTDREDIVFIEKFTISNDPEFYEAWPDVALTAGGKLITVFTECTHHGDRSYTRIMLAESIDRGRTWNKKHPLTEGTTGLAYSYNCARISRLKDGRMVIIVDRVPASGEKDCAMAPVATHANNKNAVLIPPCLLKYLPADSREPCI